MYLSSSSSFIEFYKWQGWPRHELVNNEDLYNEAFSITKLSGTKMCQLLDVPISAVKQMIPILPEKIVTNCSVPVRTFKRDIS